MSKDARDLLLLIGLVFMAGVCFTLLVHSGSGYLTRVFAAIGLFDIVIVSVLVVMGNGVD